MAINAYGSNAATAPAEKVATRSNAADGNPNGILGKDDFLKLLLTELQYQDPTAPTDTEKILSQTSQLATLETSDNTNQALEKLTASLGNTQQFSTIAAIGKTADLGSDTILKEKGSNSTFEIYFPEDIAGVGTVDISDKDGNIVGSLKVEANPAGVYQFTWDGLNAAGNEVEEGVYSVSARYSNKEGLPLQAKLGTYPIESVRFENGNAQLKVGSSYVALDKIKEIY